MTTVLITGATGLVGGDVLRYFHSKGHKIIMATSTPGVVPLVERIEILPFSLENVSGNADLYKVLRSAKVVVHCAAVRLAGGTQSEPANIEELFRLNVMGTLELMETAVKARVGGFVFMAAANLFDRQVEEITEETPPVPHDAYVLSKLIGEQIAALFGGSADTKFCLFRLNAPYGPGYKTRSVVSIFVESALAGRDLEVWGTGKRSQTFTYVRDISIACDLAMEKGAVGTFNIAGPRAVSMNELAETVVRAAGNTGSKVVLSGRSDPDERTMRKVSIRKAARAFGYTPQYDIGKGVADMIGHIRNGSPRLFGIA